MDKPLLDAKEKWLVIDDEVCIGPSVVHIIQMLDQKEPVVIVPPQRRTKGERKRNRHTRWSGQ